MSVHEQAVTLGELSTADISRDSFASLLHQHLKFYSWYCHLVEKVSQKGEELPISYQMNVFNQMHSMLAKSQKLAQN